MEYRNVGESGLKISAVSIGGWITMGGTIDNKVAHNILREALEAGVNFIDLADVYARGEAERVASTLIEQYTRSDLVISSKVYWPMSDDVNDRGLSRKHIMESIDKSLTRLKLDYLDLYFCHRYDESTPLHETVRAMDDLVRSGKILYWGTSCWEADQLREAHRIAKELNAHPPIVEQPRYNLLDRHIEGPILEACAATGMGLVVWSPLAQGLLAGRYNDGVPEDSRAATTGWLNDTLTDENVKRCQAFSKLSLEAGHKPEQVALAWCLRKNLVSSVITGASRPEQLQANIAAAEIELTSDLVAEIEKIFG